MIMMSENGVPVTASVGGNSENWWRESEVIDIEVKVLWLPTDTGKIVVTEG